MLKQFDEIIGIDELYAIHINDSKNPLKRKDRHEKIGEGSIGLKRRRIINHPMLTGWPFLLETPNGWTV